MSFMNDAELLQSIRASVQSTVHLTVQQDPSHMDMSSVDVKSHSDSTSSSSVTKLIISSSTPATLSLSSHQQVNRQPCAQNLQIQPHQKQRERRITSDNPLSKHTPRQGKQAALNSKDFVDVLVRDSPCCDQQCCKQFASVKGSILDTRQHNAKLKEHEVTEWAGTRLRQAMYAARHGAPVTQYVFNNSCVCRTAWRWIHGLTDYKLRVALAFAKGEALHNLRAQPQPNEQPQLAWVETHLTIWLQRNAEQLVPGKFWILPGYLSIRMLCQDLCIEWFNDSQLDKPSADPPSMQLIRYVLHKDFHGIIQPKKGRWGLCKLCAKLNVQRSSPNTTESDQKQLQKEREEHKRDHKGERKEQAREQGLTRTEPHNRDMVLIDLTNSAHFPHIRPTNSATKSGEKLDMRVGGLMAYGPNWRFLFGSFGNVQKGANLIITMLFFYILAIKSSDLPSAAARTFTLYIDGGSENANRYVLAFLSVLVAMGWYDNVYVSRLVVGHTHSAIDQMFKAWSAMKALRSFHDLAQFVRETKNAYVNAEKRPLFVLLLDILDWESHLLPFLPELHHHNKPLRIWIKKDVTGEVSFLYKMHSHDAKWLGERNTDGHPGTKPLIALKSLPTGIPKWLNNPLPIPNDVVRGVKNCLDFISTSESRDWLLNALDGQFSIKLVDHKLQPGGLGMLGNVSVGGVSEELRVISPDGLTITDLSPPEPVKERKQTNTDNSSDSASTPTVEIPRFAVTNRPLPKNPRKPKNPHTPKLKSKRKRDQSDDDASTDEDTGEAPRKRRHQSPSQQTQRQAESMSLSSAPNSESKSDSTESRSSEKQSLCIMELRSAEQDVAMEDAKIQEDRSFLADAEDYVAFLTDSTTHPDGLPFSVGVVCADQKDYDSPVEVRLLHTKDGQPWSFYSPVQPEKRMTVESASIITIFVELSKMGKIPLIVKRDITKNLKELAVVTVKQPVSTSNASKPSKQ